MDTVHSSQYLSPNPEGPLITEGCRWAVLMLHGFTSGPQSMLPWATALAEAGATVHVPLLSGHGTTVSDLARTTAEQWRRDAQQAADALLTQNFDKVAVAGLSMGGALALDVASHRTIDATFVVNPALSFKFVDQLGVFLSPLIHRVIPTVGPLAGDIHKPGTSEIAYDRTPVAAVEQLARLFGTARRHLSNITAPVTLYWSHQDHIVPRSSAAILRKNIEPELLETVALRRSYHVATLDYDAPVIQQHTIARLVELSRSHDETA